MLRMLSFVAVLLTAAVPLAACTKEPRPTLAPGEVPPLPPASGTPVGYLLDNATQLELRAEQIAELEKIDNSLSARNEGISTQLREIETPEQAGPTDPKAPLPPPPNMAPGAQPMRSTADSSKLHAARNANTEEALAKAFALLDPPQQTAASKLLAERGIASPKSATPAPAAAGSGATAQP